MSKFLATDGEYEGGLHCTAFVHSHTEAPVHQTPIAANPPQLLNRKQAARYLGLSPHTLAIWACNKRYSLPFVRIGRLVKYRRADLDEFIARGTVGSFAESEFG